MYSFRLLHLRRVQEIWEAAEAILHPNRRKPNLNILLWGNFEYVFLLRSSRPQPAAPRIVLSCRISSRDRNNEYSRLPPNPQRVAFDDGRTSAPRHAPRLPHHGKA